MQADFSNAIYYKLAGPFNKKLYEQQTLYLFMKPFFFLLLLLTTGFAGRTQIPRPDLNFNPDDKGNAAGGGIDGAVRDLAVQPDGKVIVAGDFFTYNNTIKPYLLRLDKNGSVDETFSAGTGVDGQVNALAIQPDGRLLIGGFFMSYDGIPRNNIARLNRYGTLDNTFDPGEGADGVVAAFAIQPDGKILAGGLFTRFNGQNRVSIVRLNANGSLDSTFVPALGYDGISRVTSIALQPDGRILLAGYFVDEDGSNLRKIIRLNRDGSIDPSFNPKSYMDDTVQTIALQKDGKILIGGALVIYNYPIRNHIVRLNADGSLDESFRNIGTDDWVSLVNKIILLDDGRILVAGSFSSYEGHPHGRINRLLPDGSTDLSFTAGQGADGEIAVMAAQPDGSFMIAGDFSSYNGSNAIKLTRINRNGGHDASFNPATGANSAIASMAIQADEKIIIAGAFTSYFNVRRNCIARINKDGSPDLSFNPGQGADAMITAVALQRDGKIIVVGSFNSFDGIARNYIARLNANGSLDASFNCNTDYPVSAIAIQPDGRILIGGFFTRVNGVARNRIARLNANGTTDAGFNTGAGANADIAAILVQPDGKILLGGAFTSYNNVARSKLARLNADGSLDLAFTPAISHLSGNINTMALQADGRVVIAGNMQSRNNPGANLVIRLNGDNGSYDEDFDSGNGFDGSIYSIALQKDGKLLTGGYFNSYNGQPTNFLTRLNTNGTPDTSFKTTTGANDAVYSLLIQEDGKLLASGPFTSIQGVGRNRIARLIIDAPAPVAKPKPVVRKETVAGSVSDKFMIYPVPASNVLFVKNPAGTRMRLEVFDNSGRKVFEGNMTETQSSIDVTKWISGSYHLVASSSDGKERFSRTFIRQ